MSFLFIKKKNVIKRITFFSAPYTGRIPFHPPQARPCHTCLFQSAHQRRVRWQHIVRFTQSAHSPLHSSHKIDVIFGNPFPFTHPCACPLRKKTCRFYDHLGFTLECRMSLLAYQTFMCRGCKISVVPPSDLLRVSHVTQPSNRPTLPDNQRPHRTFLLGYRQDFIYREYSTY